MFIFDHVASYFAAAAVKKQVNPITRQQWIATVDKASPNKHALWNTLLQKYVKHKTIRGVDTNVVDYKGIGEDPRFQNYLHYLAQLDQTKIESNPAEYLATLINAYNAICISVITNANKKGKLSLETGSINDLNGYISPIWKQKVGVFAGQRVSLDGIEHDRIRTVFQDARAHACLVCSSVSCPDLHNEAFEAHNLDETMSNRFRSWVLNRTKGVSIVGNKINLSKIFFWYAVDFQPHGELLDYLSLYDPELKKLCEVNEVGKLDINYVEYDWGVNSTASTGE